MKKKTNINLKHSGPDPRNSHLVLSCFCQKF